MNPGSTSGHLSGIMMYSLQYVATRLLPKMIVDEKATHDPDDLSNIVDLLVNTASKEAEIDFEETKRFRDKARRQKKQMPEKFPEEILEFANRDNKYFAEYCEDHIRDNIHLYEDYLIKLSERHQNKFHNTTNSSILSSHDLPQDYDLDGLLDEMMYNILEEYKFDSRDELVDSLVDHVCYGVELAPEEYPEDVVKFLIPENEEFKHYCREYVDQYFTRD